MGKATIRPRKIKSGITWEVSYYDQSGKRRRKCFRDKIRAEREQFLRSNYVAGWFYYETGTLSEMIRIYEQDCEKRENTPNYSKFRRTRVGVVEQFLGSTTLLSNIDRSAIERLKQYLLTSGTKGRRSPSTVNSYLSVLSDAFKVAKKEGLIDRSPFTIGDSAFLETHKIKETGFTDAFCRNFSKKIDQKIKHIMNDKGFSQGAATIKFLNDNCLLRHRMTSFYRKEL